MMALVGGDLVTVLGRPSPNLIAERSPYSRALLRSNGSLHSALGAARAWTLRPVHVA
jgi:hypothetical protein